ncbi:MAG: hypothetical protein D6766_12680, partial [Verrucomicrobia bacterium]
MLHGSLFQFVERGRLLSLLWAAGIPLVGVVNCGRAAGVAPSLIAYQGMDVPDSLGYTFARGYHGVFGHVQISDQGSVIFTAKAAGWEDEYTGIFRYDISDHTLSAVVRSDRFH